MLSRKGCGAIFLPTLVQTQCLQKPLKGVIPILRLVGETLSPCLSLVPSPRGSVLASPLLIQANSPHLLLSPELQIAYTGLIKGLDSSQEGS